MNDVLTALTTAIVGYRAGGYAVDRVVPCVCRCGADEFSVLFDDEVGVAARICAACGDEHGMLDSDDHFDDVEAVDMATCTCGGQKFTAAVGFALLPDGEVRWVSVGLSCTADRVAGVYVDWKIDYGPSSGLLTAT